MAAQLPLLAVLAWAASAADLLTDPVVARAGIEAFGSVEAARKVVEHGQLVEFRALQWGRCEIH